MNVGEAIRAVSTTSAQQRPWPQTIREFEAMVGELQHELVRYAYARLANLQDAEDVVQDVLVRAYRDREKRVGVTNADPYLYRAVANQCVDLLRRRRREAPLEQMPAPEADTRAAEVAAWIDALPEREAEVLRMRVYSGLAFDAIARLVGKPVATVKSRFRYGVEKLRRKMSEGGQAL